MHGMSNLNKFKESYQVLENNLALCLMRKKKLQGFIRNVLNNFFWPKIFTINTLCANVYKIYECDKNQILYFHVIFFKKPIFYKFWAIDRKWATLDKFYYFHFYK
jgi:hypothetical protein